MIDIILSVAVITLAATAMLATKAHTILNNRINHLNHFVEHLHARIKALEQEIDDNEVHEGLPNDH